MIGCGAHRVPRLAVLLCLYCCALLPGARLAGQEGGIEGTVVDEDGAPVYAASVVIGRTATEVLRGTDTDRAGYFRITDLPPGTYLVRASRLGFEEVSREVRLVGTEASLVVVEFILPQMVLALEGFSVEAERSRDRTRFEEDAGVTVREITGEQLKTIPGLAEKDPLRAVEVLPGVVTTSDFTSAFNVRGGSADQNLILLDGVPIFNPFHLGGLFSVFNGDMVSRAELLSGGFPAQYGGRVSSVLNVESDAGIGDWSLDAGISLLSSRVAVGGGLPDSWVDGMGLTTARWRFSARRSYFDVISAAVEFPYALTDLQGVFEAWTRGGSRFAVTAYSGTDRVDFAGSDNEDFPLQVDWTWGNDIVGASWSTPWARGGGGLDLRASYSRFENGLLFPDFADTDLRSAIGQATLSADVHGRIARRWYFRTGISGDRYAFDNNFVTGGTTFAAADGDGWLTSGFFQAEYQRGTEWIVEAGLRGEQWSPALGQTEFFLAPRLAVKRFVGGGEGAVKLAAGRFSQFLHSVRDEELPLGIDVWVLTGDRAPFVQSDQLQVGVEWFLTDDWFLSVEGYGRTFDGVISINQAEDPNDPLDDFLQGDGYSYGADLFLRKDGPDLGGWITLSWLQARRTFPDPLQGVYPAPETEIAPIFDRRIDVDLVLRKSLPWGVEGGLRWNFGSGLPYTRPLANFGYYGPELVSGGRFKWNGTPPGEDEEGYGEEAWGLILGPRNGERYPTYHRLDISFRKVFTKSWGHLAPYLDVLNVYNQKNVLFYFYELERNPAVRSGVSMFPVLPTIGLEIRWR